MPEIQKHLSKGMRRHIRKKKSEAKKKGINYEPIIIKSQPQTKELPDFYELLELKEPFKSIFGWMCPNCYNIVHNHIKKGIETKQGNIYIYHCKDCKHNFR